MKKLILILAIMGTASCNEAAAQTREATKTETAKPKHIETNTSVQCYAKAKSGQRCKLKTKSAAGLCHWHDPKKIEERKIKAEAKKGGDKL